MTALPASSVVDGDTPGVRSPAPTSPSVAGHASANRWYEHAQEMVEMVEMDVAEINGPLGLEDLAERQDGVVSVRQAMATGLSRSQIGRRRAAGRYKRCRRGVVRIAGVPPSWRQAVRIASIAAGEHVVVSHGSAVRLYRVRMPQPVHPRWRRDNEFIEVEAPLLRHVRLEGVRGHRSGMWEDGDIRYVAGMAVTSPLRTVIDLSARLGVEGTGQLVDELLRRGLLTTKELRERVLVLRPAPGRSVRVLRAVAAARGDDYSAGETSLEARLRRVIDRCRFPSPVGQHWVRDGKFKVRLDFAYPDVKLYLEGDGFGWHRMPSDLDHDVRKRNGLVARGWIGLHFTARMTDGEIVSHLETCFDRRTGQWRLPR